jgi:hypothetical protein
MKTALASILGALAAVIALLSPALAGAQTYRIAVVPGDYVDVDAQLAEDIVEESAWLAEDFGGYDVVRYYQLGATVGDDLGEATLGCYSDSNCYADTLYGSSIEFVLIVNIDGSGREVQVDYQTVDITLGLEVARESAWMPAPDAFAALMPPCHEALKVTPEWTTREPVETVVIEDRDDGTLVGVIEENQPRVRESHPLGQLGRIGAGTAAAGFTVIAAGVLLGYSADDIQQDIQQRPHSQTQVERMQDQGRSRQTLANVSYTVGGVAAATGLVLLIVDRRSDDAHVAFGIDPIARGVRLNVRF